MVPREHPSPNWNERPAGDRPKLLVLHYTGMPTAAGALARLCDPAAAVSAHYLIDEDGSVLALVPEAKRAWHAGRSWWRGRAGLNDVSVGIELVNPGHEWGYRPFPEPQMKALAGLAQAIMRRWSMPAWAVVAHSDIAPDRKEDPGELLDWQGLAAQGIGVWPEEMPSPPPSPIAGATGEGGGEGTDEMLARALLAEIGYPLEPEGVPFTKTLTAFQRRYRPWGVDGSLDPETMGRIVALHVLLRRLGALS